jgi:hypothetical protein
VATDDANEPILKLIKESSSQQIVERSHAVFPANLLSFLVGPPVVGDVRLQHL